MSHTPPPPYNPGPPAYHQQAPRKRRRWVWPVATAGAFVLGVGTGAAGETTAATSAADRPAPETVTVTVTAPGAKPAPAPATTVTETVTVTPKPAAAIPGDGTFVIGREVRPGTYRTSGGEACYWARLRGLGGGLSDIIANGNVTGPTTITIRASDKGFQSSNCGDWQKVG